jgi:hypothetical protein
MKECIASNLDIFIAGLVIGVFASRGADFLFKWTEARIVGDQLKLNKLLAQAVLDMQERINQK